MQSIVNSCLKFLKITSYDFAVASYTSCFSKSCVITEINYKMQVVKHTTLRISFGGIAEITAHWILHRDTPRSI